MAQRRAVHVVGALLVGRAFADDGLAANQGGPGNFRLGLGDGLFQGAEVMAVHMRNDMPAVSLEALGGVVGVPVLDMAVDGDAVVVPERNQLAQLPGAGQGAGFMGDTFHHATVTHKHIGVVVDDVMAGAIELVGQQLFRERHADGVADALAKRTGGGLDAWGVAIFRMSRGLGVQLAELLDILHAELVAGQVQQGIQEHGAMAVGQHETVAVRPLGVGRIVAQIMIPQHFGNFRHAHGGPRMAGFGFFNSVHGKRPDGIRKFSASWHDSPR